MSSSNKSPRVTVAAPPRPRRRSRRRVLLTRRELAGALNVHMMTVTKWERDGLPVAVHGRRGRPSRYREVDVRAWLQQREEAAKTTGNLDVAQERARKERAQAILAEQTYSIRARQLIPREEVERTWFAEVTAVRAKLLAWPTTHADQIARAVTLEGLPGVERLLNELVRQLLRELAEPGTTGPKRSRRSKRTAPHADGSGRSPTDREAPVAATA